MTDKKDPPPSPPPDRESLTHRRDGLGDFAERGWQMSDPTPPPDAASPPPPPPPPPSNAGAESSE